MGSEIGLLKNIPLFATLDSPSLKKIRRVLKKETYKKGQTIIKEGEMGDSLFIIIEGEVEVLKGKAKEKVTSLRPYDFFGEMSILENKPRSASILVKKDSTLLRLYKSDFERLVNKYPNISFEIMKTLSSRIRETDLRLIKNLKKKNKELRKAYSDLKNLQKELLKTERLSTIGKVAGGIIHDLKNPLSVVKCYAEYIKNSKGVTAFLNNAASTILYEIDIILKMTREILEFSKGEYKLEKISVNVDKFVREVLLISNEELEKKNIKLHLHLNTDCKCEIDPQKMRRVFFNIISNASDAMKDGGELKISTSKNKKHVNIEFTDTGIGIDKETLKNIFEPFYSKGKKKGIGLGMSIAKRIVEHHKGTIDVKSKKGNGAVVTIHIPILENR
ncbi:MAG: cyclic nucleotide-binding domain-containing protein [Candidatus Cloacimonadota bacterium]|nr:MAG: cyclic nucleotide-binding domain-containing protein [Candidatus Cloacimonadota bacterium]